MSDNVGWRRRLRIVLAACMLLGALAGSRGIGGAVCDVIPGASPMFRGSLASTDRPFARPGDWVKLQLDSKCHGSSLGFSGGTADQVVTVVFTPEAAERNVVVLTTDCAAVDTATCAAHAGIATATCVEVNGSGQVHALERHDQRTLQFQFPNTDALLLGLDDDITFSGTSAIAVTPIGAPLPCGVAVHGCAGEPGLRACVDRLFASNGTCDTTPEPTFPHFTALPPANNYAALCTETACAPVPPAQREIRFALDAAGNMLAPMDWQGVLVRRDQNPVPRLVRATTAVEAFPGRSVPLQIASETAVTAYSLQGLQVAPVFDPLRDPTATGLTLFGSADAPAGVLRVARHATVSQQCLGGTDGGLPCADGAQCRVGACRGGVCALPQCIGGPAAGLECATDDECPEGECGPGLFDFATRRVGDGTGPVVLRMGACLGGPTPLAPCADDSACHPGGQCGSFEAEALDPAPLDGLNQTPELNAFVMEEAISRKDLNGDDDETDHVITLGNRRTGTTAPIGDGGSVGLAVARVQQPPFSFPALAVENDTVAFLEPEALQSSNDRNGNGFVADTILRVFRLPDACGPAEANDVLPGLTITADAAPVVDRRSVSITDGTLYFRGGAGTVQTDLVSVGLDPTPPPEQVSELGVGTSYDGRFVVFPSVAGNLVPDDTNHTYDIFVRDRLAGTTTLVTRNPNRQPANGYSTHPVISWDGRHVAYESIASGLADPCDGFSFEPLGPNVYVHDRDRDDDGIFDESDPGATSTVCLTKTVTGAAPNGPSGLPRISADGRYVAFISHATNLVQPDFNESLDVFVHDRDADGDGIFDEEGAGSIAFERVSDAHDGEQADRDSGNIGIDLSADGRYVAFSSEASNLVSEVAFVPHVYVRDRHGAPGAIVLGSRASDGTPGNNNSYEPDLSHDGRFLAFTSYANNLVDDDTNGIALEVFLRDLHAGRTARVSIGSDGTQGYSTDPTIPIQNARTPSVSADGRYVAFHSDFAGLVPGVTQDTIRVYLHDTTTALTSLLTEGLVPGKRAYTSGASLSPDGLVVAYALVLGTAPQSGPHEFHAIARADDSTLFALPRDGDAPVALCRADAAATEGATAAFLRRESIAGESGCVGGSLNGDADVADGVVHLWQDTSGVKSLGRAATAIALSGDLIAALVSERDQAGTDLNGDGDATDDVVHVYSISGETWHNTGYAADVLDVAAPFVAFITPESAQGGANLNGDGDVLDRVVHVYDATKHVTVNVGQAAEEFVLGDGGLLAFRTREASQGGEPLNGDGDADDGVLQVFDAANSDFLNTGQAVTPCRKEACDPRQPYRVLQHTVRFLTFEGDQDARLNDDDDKTDEVLQVVNVRRALGGSAARGTKVDVGTSIDQLAAVTHGVCTTSGDGCVRDDECVGGGTCFVPPGGCIRRLDGSSCKPSETDPIRCPENQFCLATSGTEMGKCHQVEGSCRATTDCTLGAICNVSDQDFQRIANPLLGGDGAVVVTGSGRCVEDLARQCTAGTCAAGEYCEGNTCHRIHDTCAANVDCPPASMPNGTIECRKDLTRETAHDTDGDELPDPIDNCVMVSNILQVDDDRDGVGNDCDDATCGNGLPETDEQCDDGNEIGGDGCTAECVSEPTPAPTATRTVTPTPTATPTRTQAPSLPTAAAKAADGCQKALAAAGQAFAKTALKAFDACAGVGLTCIQRKPGDDGCLDKATVQCTKAVATLDAARARLYAVIGKKCGALGATDLMDAAGVGAGGIAGACAAQNAPLDGTPNALAECIARHHLCRAGDLVGVHAPRAGELLRVLGVHAGAGACIVDHGGTGSGVGDSTGTGKAVDRCAKAIMKSATRFAHQTLKDLDACATRVFRCVQKMPGNPDCLAKAAAKCESTVSPFVTEIASKCAVGPFATLASPNGVHVSALAPLCASLGVPAVESLDSLAECVRRHHRCVAEDLMRVEVPRAAELLALVGKPVASGFCDP